MNSEDRRNFILAIVLSMLVLVGWQVFYGGPLMQKERQAQTTANTPASPASSSTATAPSSAGAAAPVGGGAPVAGADKTRPEALAETKRVVIDTPSLGGSINLTGGLLDDLFLKAYRETVEPNSPNIVLFSPRSGPAPYWAETGFVPDAAANNVKTPNRDTV